MSEESHGAHSYLSLSNAHLISGCTPSVWARMLARVNRHLSEHAIDKLWWFAHAWDLARLMAPQMWKERVTESTAEEVESSKYQSQQHWRLKQTIMRRRRHWG